MSEHKRREGIKALRDICKGLKGDCDACRYMVEGQCMIMAVPPSHWRTHERRKV